MGTVPATNPGSPAAFTPSTSPAYTPPTYSPPTTSATPTTTYSAAPAPAYSPPPVETTPAAPKTTAPAECDADHYRNSSGVCVQRPGSNPAGATALCKDGSYSYSQHRSGTCSGHGGVRTWL
ncbi:DUF3761 domain-containing protein [Amycolatopsis sp. NPDC059021]|uniref:DUF3761 domain-containing protein n=1 Tax=Amycolatopsis sp. NPDC059021 TaxID=3346704 RepID=UPI00366A6090